LFVTALGRAAETIELEIDEAEIVGAISDMAAQPKDPVARRFHQRNLDRRRLGTRNRTFERKVGDLARLEPDKGGSEIIGPAPEGLIHAKRLC
jgi:hypothetical protein